MAAIYASLENTVNMKVNDDAIAVNMQANYTAS